MKDKIKRIRELRIMRRLRDYICEYTDKPINYADYISELNERSVAYEVTKNKLEWLWYSTLYKYRTTISDYLATITFEIEELEEKKNGLEAPTCYKLEFA